MQISQVFDKVSSAVQSGIQNLTGEEPPKEKQFGHDRRVVTFDLYGCLLNYRMITHFVGQVGRENKFEPELVERYFQLYLERIRLSPDFMTIRDVLETSMKYLDMEFNTKVFTKNFAELYLIYNDLKPHPDVLPTLEKLHRAGYEMYILANTDIQLISRQFDNLGGYFSEKTVLVADECRCYKPNLGFFKAAAEKFKLRSADHFHVTSNYFQDIAPACRMHWLTAYVNRSKTGVFEDLEPSVVLNSLTDLEEGMQFAKRRIEEEERAAAEREQHARLIEEKKKQVAAQAAQQAKLRQQREMAARQQQMQQKQMQQQMAGMSPQQQQQMMQQMQQQQMMQQQMAGMSPQQQQRMMQQMQQQQMMQQRMAQQQRRGPGFGMLNDDDLADFAGSGPAATPQNQYFVPQNERDAALAEKMRHMNPAKARAIARARERGLAAARGRVM